MLDWWCMFSLPNNHHHAPHYRKSCLHEISFWAKQNIFDLILCQYLVTAYIIYLEIKLIQVLFYCGCFDRNEILFRVIKCYVTTTQNEIINHTEKTSAYSEIKETFKLLVSVTCHKTVYQKILVTSPGYIICLC